MKKGVIVNQVVDFFKRIREVLFRPSQFFESIKDKGMKPAFFYLLIFTFLVALFIYFGYETSLLYLVGMIVIAVSIGITIPFLYIFALLFGGGKSFRKSFNIIIYSVTPLLLAFLLNIILGVVSRLLILKALYTIFTILQWLTLIIFIIALPYTFILAIKGIKVLYRFSTLKAFFTALIPEILILFIIIWFITPAINQPEPDEACLNATRLAIDTTQGYTCYNNLTKEVQVKVGHGSEEFNLVGMILVIAGGGQRKKFLINETSTNPDVRMLNGNYGGALSLPKVNEERIYVLKASDFGLVQEVAVAPITKIGKRTKDCGISMRVTTSPC